MQNNNCKNGQLPTQVVAEITGFFNAFNYQQINGTLLELVSAFTGPDPRSGKRHHLDICNTVDQIHKTLVFIRYCQDGFSKLDTELFIQHQGALKVSEISYIDIEAYLFDALSNWIYQDLTTSEPCLDYTSALAREFLKLSDWMLCMEQIAEKGGLSC